MNIVIYWEQESWGGTDTHLCSLLSDWPNTEDQILLITNFGNKGFARIRDHLSKLKNVKCKEINSLFVMGEKRLLSGRLASLIRIFSRPFFFVVMTFRLKILLRQLGPFDVLMSNNGGYPAAWGCLSAIMAAKRAGIPARVLVVHHGATKDGIFQGWFEKLVDNFISQAVSSIVCVSYATRQTLIDNRWLADSEQLHMRVIYNGVRESVTTSLTVKNSRDQIRAKFGVLINDIAIVIVGRVEPYKGHEDVILGMSRMNTTDAPRTKLIIIGAGDHAEITRLMAIAHMAGVSGQVIFLGYVDEAIAEVIAHIDLLVVATRTFEGFGLTLAEAMQVGTPILATRVGGIPEFVDDKVGYLVQPGDPQAIGDALDDFALNPAEWIYRAKIAKEHIGKFSSKNMSLEYRKFFTERLAEKMGRTKL